MGNILMMFNGYLLLFNDLMVIYWDIDGDMINGIFMWVKQCHKPPMTGNGLYIPPIKKGVALGMIYYFFTHITWGI